VITVMKAFICHGPTSLRWIEEELLDGTSLEEGGDALAELAGISDKIRIR